MKRTLSIILTLVLLLGALPLTVFAADVDTADTGAILSGTTGNVQFAVDDRGSNLGYKLTVTGDNTAYSQTDTYTVHNTTEQGDAPWMSYNSKITQIDISNTKYIRGAFYSCAKTFTGRDPRQSDTGLKLTMDANVKQIDSYAFANSHITETNLNKCINLETIGMYAFKNCDFTEIGFVNPIVGEGAFKDCKNLKKVYIRSNGAIIGENAFAGCTNIEYVYFGGTPDEFLACLLDGNECLKNADTIEFSKPNQREITEPIYLTVTEPVAGESPDYSLTMTPNNYCEIDTNTIYPHTGLTINNRTTGQLVNSEPFVADNIYRFRAYMDGKTGKDSNGFDYEYIFTANTPVYINGNKATVEPFNEPKTAGAYFDFTPSVQNTCTVTFNKNGGSGTMSSVQVNKGSSYTLPNCSFTPPNGNQFKNWKIGSSYYNPGDTVTVNSDITVYAQWEDDKYTITFDKNGGSGTMNPVSVNKGSYYKLPECGFTHPNGNQFKNWKIGSYVYNPGDTVAINSDTTVYAQWKGKYTITYDRNGGTGTMAAETYNEGDKYVIPACRFTPPSNMIFGGWLVDGKPDSVGNYWNVYSDHVLKPQWIPSSGIAERVDITVTAPKANELPSYDVTVYGSGNVITGNEVPVSGSPGVYTQYKGVLWRDMTTRKNHRSNVAFVDGHEYRISVDLKSLGGTTFNFEDDSKPMTQIYINGSAAEIQPAAMDNNICTAMYTFSGSSGSTVSGSYTSYIDSYQATKIELLQNDTVKYATASSGNSGSYSFPNVANGTYTLRVSKKNHVTRDYAITVSGNTTQDVKIHPLGDINGDGKVNNFDAGRVNSHARSKSTLTDYEFKCGDIDGNGKINNFDYGKINSHARNKSSLWT